MTPLEGTLNRLRQNQTQYPTGASQQTGAESKPAPIQVPTPTGPEPRVQRAWPHTTTAGTRWRLQLEQGYYNLAIDLGVDQIATVRVAPQFQFLPPAAMDARVDHVKDVIVSQYSGRSGVYLYTRDGFVFPER